jgi:hypothetical protein
MQSQPGVTYAKAFGFGHEHGAKRIVTTFGFLFGSLPVALGRLGIFQRADISLFLFLVFNEPTLTRDGLAAGINHLRILILSWVIRSWTQSHVVFLMLINERTAP